MIRNIYIFLSFLEIIFHRFLKRTNVNVSVMRERGKDDDETKSMGFL